MQYQEDLEKAKLENCALADKLQTSAQHIVKLEDRVHRLELDLTVSQEKHRTCQFEVISSLMLIILNLLNLLSHFQLCLHLKLAKYFESIFV